ncbi:granulin b [Corythoichthys intestinalis]|uniref:granulin b n=1 Tax=Corythoichthys intestinalis TaxID=161448 RepID=UPI0025A68D06|nr:progranulin-like [Corythoichthys intestinalis]XP_057682997.1 progranulin-like [Corythoichthys intestinalis]
MALRACWGALLSLACVCTALVCPDGSSCPDGSTCCKDALGRYGCCPLLRAVCCSDGLHCCPEATVCDLEHATCTNKMVTLPWKRSLPATQVNDGASAVMCPDRQSECPDAATCCELPNGSWGCCPLTKAVCCDDKLHCCPEGSVCDLVQSRCVSPGGERRPLLDKFPAGTRPNAPAGRGRDELRNISALDRRDVAVRAEPADLECPDKRSTCPDETTCCQMSSGEYGCCPMPDATCCSDKLHCCPHGTVCNLTAGTCDEPRSGGGGGVSREPETPSLPRPAKAAGANACDERTRCPEGASCCFMKSAGEWGCCPLPRAVCCEDGSHCCPAGHTCRPHRSSCSRGLGEVPWLAKIPALATAADVKCDDKSSCAAGTTCCELPTGEWGCCPLVKAVCCADREHCCPQGYSCNMATGTCEKTTPEAAPCDAEGAFACAEGETCCRSSASRWACCPSPQAVCCADMKHCCPAHFSCDPNGGCVRTPSKIADPGLL